MQEAFGSELGVWPGLGCTPAEKAQRRLTGKAGLGSKHP